MGLVRPNSIVQRQKMATSGVRIVAKIGPAAKNRDGKLRGLSAVAIGNRQSGRWPSKDVPERSGAFGRVESFGGGQEAQGNFTCARAEALRKVANVKDDDKA